MIPMTTSQNYKWSAMKKWYGNQQQHLEVTYDVMPKYYNLENVILFIYYLGLNIRYPCERSARIGTPQKREGLKKYEPSTNEEQP
jgi:hypothetical protein